MSTNMSMDFVDYKTIKVTWEVCGLFTPPMRLEVGGSWVPGLVSLTGATDEEIKAEGIAAVMEATLEKIVSNKPVRKNVFKVTALYKLTGNFIIGGKNAAAPKD